MRLHAYSTTPYATSASKPLCIASISAVFSAGVIRQCFQYDSYSSLATAVKKLILYGASDTDSHTALKYHATQFCFHLAILTSCH